MVAALQVRDPAVEVRAGRKVAHCALDPARTLTIEVEGPPDVVEGAACDIHAFLPMAALIATAEGQQLHIHASLDDGYWANFSLCFVPLIADYFGFPRIKAFRDGSLSTAPPAPAIRRAGLFFSAGVDSFYTLMQLFDQGVAVPYLIQANAGAFDENEVLSPIKASRLKAIAGEIGASPILVHTNFHLLYPRDHLRLHVIRNLSAGLALAPHVNRLFYSSTYDFEKLSFDNAKVFDADLIVHALALGMAHSESAISPLGHNATRVAKIRAIGDFGLSYRFLDVCVSTVHQAQDPQPLNCSWCNKCVRTIATLECYGLLDRYRSQFNVEAFRKDRDALLAKMYNTSVARMLDEELAQLIASTEARRADAPGP